MSIIYLDQNFNYKVIVSDFFGTKKFILRWIRKIFTVNEPFITVEQAYNIAAKSEIANDNTEIPAILEGTETLIIESLKTIKLYFMLIQLDLFM